MTRAAVRRQVTVVRAAARGAKFPFSSRGPPKKRKSPLIRADFRQYFLHNPVQLKKISRPRPIFAAAACNPKSKKAAFAAFFEVLY